MLLEENRKEGEMKSPILMMGSFACELYSKAIALDNKKKTHSLKNLYDEFDDEIKNKMVEKYVKYLELEECTKKWPDGEAIWSGYMEELKMEMEKNIDDISELFEVWRYNYEYKSYSTHYSFVLEYMKILKEVCKEMIEKE